MAKFAVSVLVVGCTYLLIRLMVHMLASNTEMDEGVMLGGIAVWFVLWNEWNTPADREGRE